MAEAPGAVQDRLRLRLDGRRQWPGGEIRSRLHLVRSCRLAITAAHDRGNRRAPSAGDARRYCAAGANVARARDRSEEHTSELQSLMRISYSVFCLKTKNTRKKQLSKN